jgi:hypothetical protein
MNGGKIEISIAAVYSQFEADMKKAAAAAVPGGKAVGKGFADGFSSGSTGYIDRAINDIRGKLTKAVGAFTIVNAFGEALKAAAEGGDWAAAIERGIKSIPVVGTFVGWGESLYDIINQTAAKAAASQDALAQQQRLNAINKAKIDAESKAREVAAAEAKIAEEQAKKVAEQRARTIEKATRESSFVQAEIEIRQLEAIGDRRSAIMKQAELDARKVFFETADQQLSTLTNEEADAIRKLGELRRNLISEEMKQRLDAINREEEETARKAAEEDARRQRQIEDETRKLMEREKELVAAAQEERLALGAATGSVSTSFGTFKFGAYTDTEKKANDKAMVSKLDSIAKSSQATVDELKRGGGGGFQ